MEQTSGTIFTITRAAQEARCSPSWVHRLIREGKLRPSVAVAGGRRMLSERDLDALRASLRPRPERAA